MLLGQKTTIIQKLHLFNQIGTEPSDNQYLVVDIGLAVKTKRFFKIKIANNFFLGCSHSPNWQHSTTRRPGEAKTNQESIEESVSCKDCIEGA